MKRYGISIGSFLIAIVISIVAYPHLPNEVVTHWNAYGQANQYSNKLWAVMIAPVLMIVMFFGMLWLPKIDPKKENYAKFTGSYALYINLFMIFFLVLHGVTIGAGLGMAINISLVIPILLAFIFIVIGNFLPKIKPNYFVGIRTPWTLANEEVWRKTHRFGGKVFVIMGVLMFATSFLQGTWKFSLFITIIIAGVLVLFIRSYYFFKKE